LRSQKWTFTLWDCRPTWILVLSYQDRELLHTGPLKKEKWVKKTFTKLNESYHEISTKEKKLRQLSWEFDKEIFLKWLPSWDFTCSKLYYIKNCRYQGISMKTTIVRVNDSSLGIFTEVPGLNVWLGPRVWAVKGKRWERLSEAQKTFFLHVLYSFRLPCSTKLNLTYHSTSQQDTNESKTRPRSTKNILKCKQHKVHENKFFLKIFFLKIYINETILYL